MDMKMAAGPFGLAQLGSSRGHEYGVRLFRDCGLLQPPQRPYFANGVRRAAAVHCSRPWIWLLIRKHREDGGLGSVEIQDSPKSLIVIQACDGSFSFDKRTMGEDGAALSGEANGPRA